MYSGKKLRQLRLKIDLNQDDMAASLELSRSYYSAMELGKREISQKVLNKIFEIYQIDKEYFLNDEVQIDTYLNEDKSSNIDNNTLLQNEDEDFTELTKEDEIYLMTVRRSEKYAEDFGFTLPTKDDEWHTICKRILKKHYDIKKYYQRIVDVKILLDEKLNIKTKSGYLADVEMNAMNSVFYGTDRKKGYLNFEYDIALQFKTKEKLLIHEKEMIDLFIYFEKWFFELFHLLYTGLRKDFAFMRKNLPKNID